MAPSGYLQVGSPQQPKGIIRPGAVNLRIPLIKRHYDGSEENLLTLASSQWTISAAPNSSASLYSQYSYIMSPPVFFENQLDRRRYGIANTPAEEGLWSRPKHLQSAASSVSLFDFESSTDSTNPFIGKDDEVDNQGELSGDPAVENAKMVPELNHATSKEATSTRLKKLRMSTRVLGKMLSHLSVHQSSSRPAGSDETPLLPSTPPQILVSLASPGIEMPRSLRANLKENLVTEDDPFIPDERADISRESRTISSTWTPYRPPSPLPESLRRRGKHRNGASTLKFLPIASPPPPLPTRPKIASTVLIDPKPAFLSFSTPLDRALNTDTMSPVWMDIEMRLKARAMKSSAYAIHDGGIISPTSS